jgi:hypothetical protein
MRSCAPIFQFANVAHRQRGRKALRPRSALALSRFSGARGSIVRTHGHRRCFYFLFEFMWLMDGTRENSRHLTEISPPTEVSSRPEFAAADGAERIRSCIFMVPGGIQFHLATAVALRNLQKELLLYRGQPNPRPMFASNPLPMAPSS